MPLIARLAIHTIAIAGLAAVAVAFGRWLREPSAGGSLVAVVALAGMCALALRRLYGPRGIVALSRGAVPPAGDAPPRPAEPDRPAAPLWANDPAAPPDDRIDLNTASEADLRTLPGVGPVLAGRIAAARPFTTVEDLAEIPGFTPARARAIADRVRV